MINEQVCVESARLRLVPYLAHHVDRYHAWMCEPELLAATESEPLSLEEERENQQSWLHALDKLTFILLAPLTTVAPTTETYRARLASAAPTRTVPPPDALVSPRETVQHVSTAHPEAYPCTLSDLHALKAAAHSPLALDETTDQLWLAAPLRASSSAPSASSVRLPLPVTFIPGVARDLRDGAIVQPSDKKGAAFVTIGDCNLFLLDSDELPDDTARDADAPPCRCFEVEVMVADPSFRRHGLAEEAVRLLMQYAVSVLGANCFVAKILDDNTGSLRLFEDKLHFTRYKEVKVFHEIHLLRYLDTEEQRQAWASEWPPQHPVSTTDSSCRCCCRPYTADLEASMVVLSQASA